MAMFPVSSDDVDRMLLVLAEENAEYKDEIKQLSKRWVTAVMGQPSKKDKTKPRSFDYSKKKINDVLKWREEKGLRISEVSDLIGSGKYDLELGDGCLYWYGTDSDGCPNFWFRENEMEWKDFHEERRMECLALVLQSVVDAMPPTVHNLNMILILDEFNPINAVLHPRVGLSFLQNFMKCCPDRLKRAVMVTGTTGLIFYKIAKNFAPKNLVDKIHVVSSKDMARKYMIEQGIVTGSSDSEAASATATCTSSSSSDEKEENDGSTLPNFLGGKYVHKDEIIKSLPLMVAAVKESVL